MEQLDSTIIATAIPAMAESFGEPPVRLNLAITSYILSLAVFIPISGWLADRLGARRVFCAAIVVFTLGSVACGLAQSLPMLVATRVLQGIGGAMMSPVGRLILLRSFPKEQLVTAMAYVSIPALVGPTLGPLVGGALTTYASWRWIFFVNIPVGVVGIALALRYVEDVRSSVPPRFDVLGFLICGAGLGLLQLALETVGRPVLAPATVGAILAAAALCLALYAWHARRHPNPVLDLSLFRIRTFRIGTLTGGLCRVGMNAVPFLMPLMFQLGFGLTALESGLLTFASAIGAMTVKPVSATLLRACGFRRLLGANAVLAALWTAGFALFAPATPHALILAYVTVYGVIRTTQFSAINMVSYADIPPSRLSRSTSLGGVAQQLTLGFGVSLGAALLDTLAGPGGALPPETFRTAFLAMGALVLVSALGFLGLRFQDGSQVSGHRVRPAASGSEAGT